MTSAFAIRMQGMEQAAYEAWVQTRNVQEIPLCSVDPWNRDERMRMEMQGEMRDRNIHISKVFAIITAVAAAALAISGLLFSLSALYFGIAIGTVSLILLGTYCYLRSVQNALEADFVQQKIRESIIVSRDIMIVALRQADSASLKQIIEDDVLRMRDVRGDTLYNKFQDIRGKITGDVTRYIDMYRAHTVDTIDIWEVQPNTFTKNCLEPIITKVQAEWRAWRPTID